MKVSLTCTVRLMVLVEAVSAVHVKQGRMGRRGCRLLCCPQFDRRRAAGEVHEDHRGCALGHDERGVADRRLVHRAVARASPHHGVEVVVARRVGQGSLAASAFAAAENETILTFEFQINIDLCELD